MCDVGRDGKREEGGAARDSGTFRADVLIVGNFGLINNSTGESLLILKTHIKSTDLTSCLMITAIFVH
jgi:hypothetical protein